MHYLSVHDLVWINSTITGETPTFNFQTLEASMAAQYGYGVSTDVSAQAANLLATLLTKRPFAVANLRTAFIAVTTFLNANGYALQVEDAAAATMIRQAAAGTLSPSDAISALSESANIGLRPGVALRMLVTHICNEHTEAVESLAEGDE